MSRSFKVFRECESAILPSRGSHGAVGYDLTSVDEVCIEPGRSVPVSTGISVALPENPPCYLRIAPRSGLAVRHQIDVLAGVIDPDYRGVIKVVLINFGREPFYVKAGDRIAQALFEVCVTPEVEEVKDKEALGSTVRSDRGFGSTG